MILSDRSRGAASATRPRTGATAPAAPEPKALCPGCRRPVVMARLGKCLYCGGAVETPVAEAPVPAPATPPSEAPASTFPPEVLFALEPKEAPPDRRRLWTMRIVGVTLVLLALLTMLAHSVGSPE